MKELKIVDNYSLCWKNTPFNAVVIELPEDKSTLFILKDLDDNSKPFKSLTNNIEEVISKIKDLDLSKYHNYLYLTLGSDEVYSEFVDSSSSGQWFNFNSTNTQEAIMEVLKRNNTRTYNILKFKEGIHSK